MSTHVDMDGARWPAVASRSQRVAWARAILREELSVILPEDTIHCDDDLRTLAHAILASLKWDAKLRRAEERNTP